MTLKIKKFLSQKIYPSRSLFLRTIGWAFVPILGFIIFSFLSYPFRPHCSLGNGIFGCTPMCEPTFYFEDGRPAGYKVVPCYHDNPSGFQKALFKNWYLILLFFFIFFSLWIYKGGAREVFKKLKYIAFSPIYLFKENRKNKNLLSRLIVIFMLFFLFIEWALGYYVAGTTILGKEPFNFFTPSSQSTQIDTFPSFTGQDIFDAVNKYRKENNVSELKLDEVICNNIAQRYLDIKSGEKESIAHKGFDDWYKKYVEPYGYTVSENYACGQTPEEIIKAWDSSPSHKLSILDEKNKFACTYASEGCTVIILGYKTPPQVKGTQTNNDPIVNCQISSECGGGSRQMRKSECDQTTCCQIGNNWYFYLSKDKCLQDQRTNQPPQQVVIQSSPTSNKVPVFISYGGYTIYCPQQNVSAVQSINSTMESKKMEWAKNYNTCADNFYKTDSCYVSCKSIMDSEWNICTSTYGYSGDEYNNCTQNASDNYSNCIKNCPSVNQACDYVYWEQKNLSSQITELCR